MFVKLTDAVSLLGHVNHELVEKRRKAIEPHLKEEYRSLTCTLQISRREIIVWRRFSQRATQCKRDELLL